MEKQSFMQHGGYLQALLASCPVAIIAINSEGTITFANEEACKLAEREMHELVGESIATIYETPEAARETNRKLYECGGTIHDHESKTKTKKGKIVPVRISASHLKDSTGKYMGAVGYFEIYRPWNSVEVQVKTRCEELEAKLEEQGNIITPIFELYPGISAMIMDGHLDACRFEGIVPNLLNHVKSMKSQVLIIDLSAALIADDNIANQLTKAVRTIHLLGTKTILVGMQTSVAQAMEPVIADMGPFRSFSSIDTALHAAFDIIGFEIRRKD